ncbi:boophilin-G2-like [Dermacentor silvarum]|uniref:boophilin-G2-like n=1 Tax=Dermacentor silvarum TaxID=543639 RepID=UPI002100D435|nr:boophilin-G2-like [Dermacentor silvarum]
MWLIAMTFSLSLLLFHKPPYFHTFRGRQRDVARPDVQIRRAAAVVYMAQRFSRHAGRTMYPLLIFVAASACAPCIAVRKYERPGVCGQPKDVGERGRICVGAGERWYFSQNSSVCKPFKYSGCGGNANRFITEDECKNRCGKHGKGKDKNLSRLCYSRPEQGRCKAAFTRVYWRNGRCVEYTGCYRGGFDTIRKCKKACGSATRPNRPGSGIRPRQGI